MFNYIVVKASFVELISEENRTRYVGNHTREDCWEERLSGNSFSGDASYTHHDYVNKRDDRHFSSDDIYEIQERFVTLKVIYSVGNNTYEVRKTIRSNSSEINRLYVKCERKNPNNVIGISENRFGFFLE